jgi:Uma2 family endonuclease
MSVDEDSIMATNPSDRKYTVEDYLAFDNESDNRHEFMDGKIYAMSDGTDKHVDIISNVNTALSIATRHRCRVRPNDMPVKIDHKTYFYPDITVTCGESKYEDDNHTMLLNPTIVIEVISTSSEAFDKGLKAELYRSLDSVQAYLIIDQHRVFAQLSVRQDDGWFLREFNQIEQSIPLNVINVNLSLRDVYLDVTFDAE